VRVRCGNPLGYCCGFPHNGFLLSEPSTWASTSASPSRATGVFLRERATLAFLPCFLACTAFLIPLCGALPGAGSVEACWAQMPALIQAVVRRATASFLYIIDSREILIWFRDTVVAHYCFTTCSNSGIGGDVGRRRMLLSSASNLGRASA